MTNEPLLEVWHLKKYYPLRPTWPSRAAGVVRAVDDVSFAIHPGETLGLVGESGCGKSTTGKVILRLAEPTAGEVILRLDDGKARQTHVISSLPGRPLRRLRRHIQMIFQDPYGSLNPRLTVGTALEEGLRAHGLGNRVERRRRVEDLLERVGLERAARHKYPHAFSGGQRQRIGIARALAVDPVFVVCDEPVAALDVSVQAQILNLLLDLQCERRLAYLFIAHDLAVVGHVSRRVAVMYQGQIVEAAPTAELFQRPAHPYTRTLLAAVGQVANPSELQDGFSTRPTGLEPRGCRFQPRCPERQPECAHEEPPLIQIGAGHQVRCHLCKAPPT